MSNGPANLQVWVDDTFVCIRIAGRASFQGSVDFKALVTALWEKGHTRFVLDLTDCQLMDSTFLGVLAGLGLKFNAEKNGKPAACLELVNPNPRVADMLDNLGIAHLFKILSTPPPGTGEMNRLEPVAGGADKKEVSRTCLEAHRVLMAVDPGNVPKFKDVTRFLEEDLKRMESE